MALLRFKHAYREAGLELSDEELPDHLAVVLEFASTGDAASGMRLLLEHRAGLEVLRLALEDARSPYVDVLRAVSATLPPLAGPDREAVARWLRKGRRRGGRAAAVRSAGVHARHAGEPARDAVPARDQRQPPVDVVPEGPVSGTATLLWVVLPYVCLAVFASALLALPLRQVRLDHALLADVRAEAAALGQPDVPLRHPVRVHGARDGPRIPHSWTEASASPKACTTRWPSASARSPVSARSSAWRC
jgi:hypothetical protein